MAVFERTMVIEAGSRAAVAKTVPRTVRINAGSRSADDRVPTKVLLTEAGAEMLVETAADYVRQVEERVGASVTAGPKEVTKVMQISAGARVQHRVGATGVNSYLMLRSEILDQEGFIALTRHGPQGFEKFVRIYPGEYTFKDAVTRSTMLTREPTTKPKLTRLKPIVDVPDRILQGSYEITDALAGVDIVFDPAFYSVPEVAALWQSGTTVGLARIGAPTREGVNVYIDDPANPGTRLTGMVSVMIQGY